MTIFTDGNTVRVVSEPEIRKKTQKTSTKKPVQTEPVRRQRKTAAPVRTAVRPAQAEAARKRNSAKAKARKKSTALRALAIAATVAIVVGMSMLYLSTVVENNELVRNIGILETRLDDLKAKNDAKEFEINSSVDLNQVIYVATEELGMIRGTAEQIRTYDTSKSEYIQHLAGIPSE